MTNLELSSEFDILYNNITSNQAPALDEYEKSVFLTKAQDEILKCYFVNTSNSLHKGFDGNQRRQIDFSKLIKTTTGTLVTPTININHGSNICYYAIPTDILVYINEFLTVDRESKIIDLTVTPLSYDEYWRLMNKPFKKPVKNQAWRLISNGSQDSYYYTDYSKISSILNKFLDKSLNTNIIYNIIHNREITTSNSKILIDGDYLCYDGKLSIVSDLAVNFTTDIIDLINSFINISVNPKWSIVELIPGPNDTIKNYIIRYIARPKPIILTDLTEDDLTISGGNSNKQECELDPILHPEILQRAVELAKAAYIGDLQSQITLGKISQTNIGQ